MRKTTSLIVDDPEFDVLLESFYTLYHENGTNKPLPGFFVEAIFHSLLRGGIGYVTACLFASDIAEKLCEDKVSHNYVTKAREYETSKELAKQKGIELNNFRQLYDAYGVMSYLREDEPKGASVEQPEWLKSLNVLGWWRFRRLLDLSAPLLQAFPDSSWLTLGDGRWGLEARYFVQKGCKALPVDVDPRLLAEAKAWGYIDEYQYEHAEHLSFEDNSFDFVCCKDMLHHLCRPHQGLYEAMRVSRYGVFFLEPFDHGCSESALRGTRSSQSWHDFEPEPGNYIFAFSEREVEKMCMTQCFPCVAFKGCNDIYDISIDELPYYEYTEGGTDETEAAYNLRLRLEHRDIESNKTKDWDMLAAILLKQVPSESLRQGLKQAGYTIIDLVSNPYLEPAVLRMLMRKTRNETRATEFYGLN